MKNTLKFSLISTVLFNIILCSNIGYTLEEAFLSMDSDYFARIEAEKAAKNNEAEQRLSGPFNSEEEEYQNLVKYVLNFVLDNNGCIEYDQFHNAPSTFFVPKILEEKMKQFANTTSIREFLIQVDSNTLTDDEFMLKIRGIMNRHKYITLKNGQIWLQHYHYKFSHEDSARFRKINIERAKIRQQRNEESKKRRAETKQLKQITNNNTNI